MRMVNGSDTLRVVHTPLLGVIVLCMGVPAGAQTPKLERSGILTLGAFRSVQVNVNAKGENILGDFAQQPSLTLDPADPNRIVIGWQHYNSVESHWPRGGRAFSHDGGVVWTFPGVLEDQFIGRAPILGADAEGNMYYSAFSGESGYTLFTSSDAGVTWSRRVHFFRGREGRIAIDQTAGPGRNNIYLLYWFGFGSGGQFTRSVDRGQSFSEPQTLPGNAGLGAVDIGPNGELYILESQLELLRSNDVMLDVAEPRFTRLSVVPLCRSDGCTDDATVSPNPGGSLGQPSLSVDRSDTATGGNVYAMQSIRRDEDPRDVMFARSLDGGATWSRSVRVNDDPSGTHAWQWFGVMSVAPSGRIDVVWNDTRNTGVENLSQLFYAFSADGGISWSANVALSSVFDSHIGSPGDRGIGDYYDMASTDRGPSIAYAATFYGEQDIFFMRFDLDCDGNGIADADETGDGRAEDCNGNFIPDVCEFDLDGDGLVNGCDIDLDNDGVRNDLDACPLVPLDGPSDAAGRPFSDTNQNCVVDLIDYARFRKCLKSGGPNVDAPVETCLVAFDYNGDGHVDLRDVAGFGNAFTGIP